MRPASSVSRAGLASARAMSTRCWRDRQHQRGFEFVGMAAMALLGQLLGRAGIARAPVNPQMPGPAGVETRQRAIDRRQRADSGIEHDQLPASVAENSRCDFVDERLECRSRQAAASGIFDEGRIMAVAQGRPDQRIELSRQSACEPFGLNAVGIKGKVKSVLLRRRANRQYRGRAVMDPPRDFVPTHAFDEMAICVSMRHHRLSCSGPSCIVTRRRKRPSKVLP